MLTWQMTTQALQAAQGPETSTSYPMQSYTVELNPSPHTLHTCLAACSVCPAVHLPSLLAAAAAHCCLAGSVRPKLS